MNEHAVGNGHLAVGPKQTYFTGDTAIADFPGTKAAGEQVREPNFLEILTARMCRQANDLAATGGPTNPG
ncbi:hypothetical protein LU306_29085 [Burkholderia gladioli]|nr:hypothetical protein [Burkholderia gladioli]MDD1790170.1 hypothetical protein [Burkholderia gladioli]